MTRRIHSSHDLFSLETFIVIASAYQVAAEVSLNNRVTWKVRRVDPTKGICQISFNA